MYSHLHFKKWLMILCASTFEHLLSKECPFKNLRMTDIFKKGRILNVSLNTFCAHSRSAKVKSDLCTCGIGREETEEQPSMGHPGVLFGTAIWEFLHPHVYSTCRRDKQWWLSENWGPLQSHRVCCPLSRGTRSKAWETLVSVSVTLPFPSQPSSSGKDGSCPGQTQARAHGCLPCSPGQDGPASYKTAGVLSSCSHQFGQNSAQTPLDCKCRKVRKTN